jgi:hypothetical protein
MVAVFAEHPGPHHTRLSRREVSTDRHLCYIIALRVQYSNRYGVTD